MFQKIKTDIEHNFTTRIAYLNKAHNEQSDKLRQLHGHSKPEYIKLLETQIDDQENEI